MAARIPEAGPLGPHRGARPISAGNRMLFVFGLLLFGVTSMYVSVALLARVTPALFPGETLSEVLPGNIPASSIVPDPGSDSVFNRRINILVMGLDSRPEQEADLSLPIEERYKARTDTLMVASVDPVTESTNFLSFPRDMVIDVHPKTGGAYQTRVNESFLEGLQSEKSVEAGAEQVQRDLQMNFGIETDYWVILDFRGVAEVIDAVGGIDVVIPEELAVYDWWYSDDDKDHKLISIPAGRQHLDGYMAVALSRNRDPNDLARIQRQQIVMEAAISQAFSEGALNPGSWPGLWDAYRSTIKTNIPKGRLPGYANLLRETQGRMTMYSLGEPVQGTPTVWDGWLYGASVLYWDPANVRYWIARTFPEEEYANATVELRSGLGPEGEGFALTVGRFLEFEMAIPTVYVGPPADSAVESEILVYGDDRRELAEDIAEWLSLPRSSIQELPRDDDSLPDVEVILGGDAEAPVDPDAIAAGG